MRLCGYHSHVGITQVPQRSHISAGCIHLTTRKIYDFKLDLLMSLKSQERGCQELPTVMWDATRHSCGYFYPAPMESMVNDVRHVHVVGLPCQYVRPPRPRLPCQYVRPPRPRLPCQYVRPPRPRLPCQYVRPPRPRLPYRQN